MILDANLRSLEMPDLRVLPEWVDINGHMNVAFYVLAFDRGVDTFMSRIGITPTYIQRHRASVFTLEIHVNYFRELCLGDPIRIDCQLLDFDSKRVHYFLRMFNAEKHYIAATSEQIIIHVDLKTRRSCPFPEDVRLLTGQLMDEHQRLPWPEECGHTIGIEKKGHYS